MLGDLLGLERQESVLLKAKVKEQENYLGEMPKENLLMVMVKGNLMMVMVMVMVKVKILRVAMRLKMAVEMVKKADEVVVGKVKKLMLIMNCVYFL